LLSLSSLLQAEQVEAWEGLPPGLATHPTPSPGVPTHPPSHRTLPSLQAEQVEAWEGLPPGLQAEVGSPHCFLCEAPQRLVVPHQMRGWPKIFALEKKVGGREGGRVGGGAVVAAGLRFWEGCVQLPALTLCRHPAPTTDTACTSLIHKPTHAPDAAAAQGGAAPPTSLDPSASCILPHTLHLLRPPQLHKAAQLGLRPAPKTNTSDFSWAAFGPPPEDGKALPPSQVGWGVRCGWDAAQVG